MKVHCRTLVVVAALGAAMLLTPAAAHAYGGPGSIISGIGALLAVLAAVAAAIFGFLWFPVKRLIQKVRGGGEQSETDVTGASERHMVGE